MYPVQFEYYDTHCHLDLYSAPKDIIHRAIDSKVFVLAVTNAPSVFMETERLCKGHSNLAAALGLHPELVAERKSETALFKKLIHRTPYVGEIGLDQKRSTKNHHEQMQVFGEVISECRRLGNRVLTIHTRGSVSSANQVIGNGFNGRVIYHWYSGSLTELRRAIEYGYYFSVNAAMIESKKGQQIIRNIPAERLLTESDGPFTTVDNRPCEPSDIPRITESLASVLNKTADDIRSQCALNAQRVLNPAV